MPIKIFIYDDNRAWRDSIKTLIDVSEGLLFVGEAANCANAEGDMLLTTPDVVLMDINMPKSDGIAGLRKIKQSSFDTKVLMLTVSDDSEKVFASIKCGASGYILKKDSGENLVSAIRDVHEGGAVMTPDIAKKVIDFFKPRSHPILSLREMEVLTLLARGDSYKMVANELDISFNTVSVHAKKIYEKLHVTSLGGAIAYYYKNMQPNYDGDKTAYKD